MLSGESQMFMLGVQKMKAITNSERLIKWLDKRIDGLEFPLNGSSAVTLRSVRLTQPMKELPRVG